MSTSDVLFSMFPIPINSSTTFTQPGIKPINNGKECVDLHGRNIPQGVHYVPGPDECTLCICDEEGPIWCKAVLCSPPQECKSFRVGNSCCEFICLDDTINGGKGRGLKPPIDTAEVVPKIIIASVCSMLSLALLSFLVYRLRQRHIQGRINSAEACHSAQMCDECDDTRSLDFSNDCYFERPGVNSNFYPPHYLASWKPPSSYFPPRGEAPPPYEEAIATTSNCLMPPYNMNGSNVNGFSPAAVNTTIILTNENINRNQNQTQTQPTVPSAPCRVEPVDGANHSSVVNGDSLSSSSMEVPRHSANNLSCSSSPADSSKVDKGDSGEPVAGPSCVIQSSSETVPPKAASVNGVKVQSQIHLSDTFPCDSSRDLESTSETLVCQSSGNPVFLTLDSELPPYSASNFRDCFRHSLTLPRHPRHFMGLGIDADGDYSRRHQQRYSLQFNVADWSSSSSTLSLSTPNTPCGRPESSLSSSTSSSNNTQTTH